MARKKEKKLTPARPQLGDNVEILSAGEVLESAITDTLETNYMPYAMSVIVSRALPEIDGFKPAHRKLLYTMYEMGLLKGNRTKSANIVGSTMHLNPHGDAAIYDTMVRMGRSNESLLVPFVDSKGNFGKAYSRDMAYAAARYTEAKLEPVCDELFRDIDKDTVDFVPNYDGTTTEPTLLPVTFPTILANNTLGIAVGMASNICSFNLEELCNATIALMKDPQADLREIIPAPDFVGGGTILYDAADEIGRGDDLSQVSLRVFHQRNRRVAELFEVEGADVRRHTDGDAQRIVRQNRREGDGQQRRFGRRAVIVGHKVDGVLVDVTEQLVADGFELGLGVTGGGIGHIAAVRLAEVTLGVDKRYEQALVGASHTHHRVIDGGVAVGVQVHRAADDVGTLGAVALQQPHLVHRVEQLAVGGLEAVDLRQRAGDDDAHRVGHIVGFQRVGDGGFQHLARR